MFLKIFGDTEANKIVDGVAVHWYWDNVSSPTLLTKAHEKYPDKFILYTEVILFPIAENHEFLACIVSFRRKIEPGQWLDDR